MKTSRAPVQSPRISASVRLTCLPGRLPRTSRSLAMTSSTSVGPEGAVEEDAIHPRSERSACSRGRSSSSQSGHLTAARDKRGSRGRFGPAARTLGKLCGLCAPPWNNRRTATANRSSGLVRKGGKGANGVRRASLSTDFRQATFYQNSSLAAAARGRDAHTEDSVTQGPPHIHSVFDVARPSPPCFQA